MSKEGSAPLRSPCIFCGVTADSKEHIWPKWARPLLSIEDRHRSFSIRDHYTPAAHFRVDKLANGAVASTRLKLVCRSCNNGWMSAYEEAVRSSLTMLIAGESFTLVGHERKALAEYLAMKIMVIDWSDQQPAISQSDRTTFFDKRLIPPSLYIDCYNIAEETNVAQFICDAARATKAQQRREDGVNLRSYAVWYGKLFVFGRYSRSAYIAPFLPVRAEALAPARANPLEWPPAYSLTWQESLKAAGSLRGLVRP